MSRTQQEPHSKDAQRHHHRDERRLSPFWRHFLEMAAVMLVGMFAAAAILVAASDLGSWDLVTSEHPTLALLRMAAGMSLPMTAWMLIRGMGRRTSYELAVAMVVPAVPFLCLVWLGITDSALCGPYCVLSFVAMYGLMRYRRDAYAMHAMHA